MLLRGQHLQAHHLVPEGSTRITWESAGPNSRHESSTENACRSPTLLMEASASRSRVFIERNFSLTVCKGSNGPCCSALSTRDRSQEGIEGGRGGFNLLAPPPKEPDDQVLHDLAQCLCKKAHWGKRILAKAPQPAVCQCVRAECSLGQGVKQLAMRGL